MAPPTTPAAFQSAVNAARTRRCGAHAPAGTIRITSTVTVPAVGTSRRLFIQGAGQVQTRFRLSASGRFDFDLGVSSEWDNGHLVLRDFAVLCDSAETITAVTARFARVSGATAQTSIIENVEVVGVSDTTGPKVAFHLVDASALRFRGSRIQGRRSGGGSDTVGVLLSGGSIPVEIYLSEINVYFMNTAFLVDGTADRRLEGVHFDKCAAVACAYGVTANAAPTDQSLWIKVSQSHFKLHEGRNLDEQLREHPLHGQPDLRSSRQRRISRVPRRERLQRRRLRGGAPQHDRRQHHRVRGEHDRGEERHPDRRRRIGGFDPHLQQHPRFLRYGDLVGADREPGGDRATNMFKSNTTPTLNQGSNNVVAPALVTW